MSRIGKLAIALPPNVRVEPWQDNSEHYLRIQGPKGETTMPWAGDRLKYQIDTQKKPAAWAGNKTDNSKQPMEITITRLDNERSTRAIHGTMRANLANRIIGVTRGFERKLSLVGVGYRVLKKGQDLEFALGYSNKLIVPIPKYIQIEVSAQAKMTLTSVEKEKLGTFVSQLKSLRKIDPYKGKGLLEDGIPIRRKAGKSGKVAQK